MFKTSISVWVNGDSIVDIAFVFHIKTLSKFHFNFVGLHLLHLMQYQTSMVMPDSTVDASLELKEVAKADNFSFGNNDCFDSYPIRVSHNLVHI